MGKAPERLKIANEPYRPGNLFPSGKIQDGEGNLMDPISRQAAKDKIRASRAHAYGAPTLGSST